MSQPISPPPQHHSSLNKTLPIKIMGEKTWIKDNLYVSITWAGWKP